MTFELLRPQDATLLHAQDPRAPLQIGALALFDAGPLRAEDGSLRIADLRRHVASRLTGAPRFRQRLVEPPLGIGPAVWVDDPGFDVADHVLIAALPRPGDRAGLRDLVARIAERPLDPGRPLWQIWVVEGVEGDRVAVIPKVSHVMADGMALLDVVLRLLDLSPDTPPEAGAADAGTVADDGTLSEAAAPAAGAGSPSRATGGSAASAASALPLRLSLLARASVARGRRQVAAGLGALGLVRHPDRVVATGAALARAVVRARPAPASPINRPVGRRRDMTWSRQPMAALMAVKRSQGVSLNDVVLAAVAGATGSLLGGTGPTGRPPRPRVLVPVSIHGPSPQAEIENRFSLMLADLPVGIDDPLERLRHVHAEMVRRKRSAETSLGAVLLAASDVLPGWLIRLIAPTVLGRQPVVNLVVTNLPGTDQPLYLLGAQLREAYPFVTVIGNISLIVGVVSYGDSLGVGITVDPDVVDDVDGFAAALDRSFADLVAAAAADGDTAAGGDDPGQARLDDRG